MFLGCKHTTDTVTAYPKEGKNYVSRCCTDKGTVMPVAAALEEAVASQRGLAAIILASLAADVLLSGISNLNPWY